MAGKEPDIRGGPEPQIHLNDIVHPDLKFSGFGRKKTKVDGRSRYRKKLAIHDIVTGITLPVRFVL